MKLGLLQSTLPAPLTQRTSSGRQTKISSPQNKTCICMCVRVEIRQDLVDHILEPPHCETEQASEKGTAQKHGAPSIQFGSAQCKVISLVQKQINTPVGKKRCLLESLQMPASGRECTFLMIFGNTMAVWKDSPYHPKRQGTSFQPKSNLQHDLLQYDQA